LRRGHPDKQARAVAESRSRHAKCRWVTGGGAGQSGEERKQFFFEKKNQKTFAYWARACGQSQGMKVFCFFFSKKKTFL
jgi:hypothetical protein